MRGLPIFSTIVVLIACGIMVVFGFWQLNRVDEKATMIAEFEANQNLPPMGQLSLNATILDAEMDASGNWSVAEFEGAMYRSVEVDCSSPQGWTAVAGRNASDQTGYVHRVLCEEVVMGFVDGSSMELRVHATLGWSRGPRRPDWDGGLVAGVLKKSGGEYEVVADPPLAGLDANKVPDPNDLPNNHLAYAVQWFLFAAIALIIYILALRRRRR